MNKKGYAEAKKNHYNVKVIKGEHAKRVSAKAEAEAKAKPEAIKAKSDLMRAEKSRLTHELEYERKYLNSKRNKPYYMASVTEDIARRYESISIKAEAIQRIDADTEAEAEAKAEAKRYNTCAEWLSEPDTVRQLKPIDCQLWAFARKQSTMQSKSILTYSESGLRKNDLEYMDYKQTCYLTLFEYALDNPNDSFKDALYLCMKKGIYNEWRKSHHATRNEDGVVIERIIASLDCPLDKEDSESASLKDALPDTYAKPLDYNLIMHEKCESVILTYTRNDAEERILKDIASGYTLKESAFYSGEKYDTTKKRYERMKAKAIEKEKRLTEKAKAETEKRKAKAEARRKAEAPKEPEAWKVGSKNKAEAEAKHKAIAEAKMRVKPYNFTYSDDDLNKLNCVAWNSHENSIHKYTEYTDNKQLLDRIAKADKECKAIKEAEKRNYLLNHPEAVNVTEAEVNKWYREDFRK